MWWFIPFIIIIIIIYALADEAIKNFKSKDFESHKEIIKKEHIKIEEEYELLINLKSNIGKIVTIKSDELIYVNQNNIMRYAREITGEILDIDEEWINLKYTTKRLFRKQKTKELLFRTDSVNSFSIAVEI